MQNLTSRYNIIYNAENILRVSRQNIEQLTVDDYTQILPVYKDATEETAQSEINLLDSVIKKANVIVSEKAKSKYVGNAYFFIAEANFLKAKFYDAGEFYSYVYTSYPEDIDLVQLSRVKKSRALMQLGYQLEADSLLDTAFNNRTLSKKTLGEVYAAKTQSYINRLQFPEAEEMIIQALESKPTKDLFLRWTFLLAQLQEKNRELEYAYQNYTRIVKSNAPFEMAFNAELNRVRINDRGKDRIAILKSMLKNDKSDGFEDQIYFKIANIHEDKKLLQDAILNYKKSIAVSKGNTSQKGQSYLKLAELYFQQGNYLSAKAYYDSTLTALPPSYPGIDLIQKKAGGLDFLATRFQRIKDEETLQYLATLPESERREKVKELIKNEPDERSLSTSSVEKGNSRDRSVATGNNATAEKFYFYNSTAVKQGLNDFKRRWGNRQLRDNWRRSADSGTDQSANLPDSATPEVTPESKETAALTGDLFQDYLSRIPQDPAQIKLSNERMATALYEIGSFYRTELQDREQAGVLFEDLLKRVPNSSYTLPVYYNLYLVNLDVNTTKSDYYKNLLLSKYPESAFSKAIVNPLYGTVSKEKEEELNRLYTAVYSLYTSKKYFDVINQIQNIENKHGQTFLSAQLAYLKALSIGHTQKLPPFEEFLNTIVTQHPEDSLVTPLVRQHLQHINRYRQEFSNRNTALLNYDPLIAIFEPETAFEDNNNVKAPIQKDPDPKTVTAIPDPSTLARPATDRTIIPASQFSLPDSAEYYFVINVSNGIANLSPSRFGIGQFNRFRYSDLAIKHQLKVVDKENQLIFVGPFTDIINVNNYKSSILPMMKSIMKIPADDYSTFIITKDGLDRLDNRQTIESYLEYLRTVSN